MGEIATRLESDFRSPRNLHSEAKGSIHNDEIGRAHV